MADVVQTIRLFVSPTFADYQQERELLQRHVFPAIAKLCQAEGFRFLPFDLRWGASEQASTAQPTLPVVTKPEFMAHFDLWTTAPQVTKAGVDAFVVDQATIGTPFSGATEAGRPPAPSSRS